MPDHWVDSAHFIGLTDIDFEIFWLVENRRRVLKGVKMQ